MFRQHTSIYYYLLIFYTNILLSNWFLFKEEFSKSISIFMVIFNWKIGISFNLINKYEIFYLGEFPEFIKLKNKEKQSNLISCAFAIGNLESEITLLRQRYDLSIRAVLIASANIAALLLPSVIDCQETLIVLVWKIVLELSTFLVSWSQSLSHILGIHILGMIDY